MRVIFLEGGKEIYSTCLPLLPRKGEYVELILENESCTMFHVERVIFDVRRNNARLEVIRLEA